MGRPATRKRSWWIQLLMLCLSDTVYAQILTFHLLSCSGKKKENMGAVYLPLIIQPVEAYRTHIPSLVSLAVGGTVTYPRSDAYVPLQQPRSYLQPWMALTPWRTGPNNTQTLRLPGSLCPERCPPARWNYRLRWQPNTQRMEISFPSILICHKRKVNGHPMRYTI